MLHPYSLKPLNRIKRMEPQLTYTPEKQTERFKYRSPLIFSIPRMYEDDYERNDQWYFDLQKIEKQAKELRNELAEITRMHLHLYQQTKKIIAASLERRSNQIQRS